MKINIVHIVEDLKTGGLERVIASIVTGLDSEKFNLQVWCLSRGGNIYDQLEANGVAIENLHMKSARDLLFLIKLCQKFKTNKIDIAHTHGYTATTIGRLTAFFAGVKVIIAHIHSTYYNYNKKQLFIEKIFSLFTKKIICCSKAVADFVRKNENIDPRKIQVIYNGIDVNKFEVVSSVKKQENKRFTIGCVASLVEHKGHKYLLEAAKEVLGALPDKVRFMLVGDGVLRQQLEEQARTLGIAEYVSFMGNVKNIEALIGTFDIGVLPSCEREGLGLALLEAMAGGIPVIGTNVGGIPEIIENKKNGILVKPYDSKSIAQAIIAMCNDWPRTKTMGEKARLTVEKKFSKEGMLKAITKLYLELYYGKKYKKTI
ncbi:MAG: glycosyltransferase [Candidatus Omnitrophica bacterium]|nr:glycosyltransferase [Candidatus Omnitrophota bacterium]